jgi:hypothetical protein
MFLTVVVSRLAVCQCCFLQVCPCGGFHGRPCCGRVIFRFVDMVDVADLLYDASLIVRCKRVLGIEIGCNNCVGCVFLVAPICVKSCAGAL